MEQKKTGSFQDLTCWQSAYDLKSKLRMMVLDKLPKDEKYELHSQLRRASRSVTANIAEGWGRFHYKDQIRFLFNARGSLAECEDHCIEAFECQYITKQVLEELTFHVRSSLKLCNGYIRYLKTQYEKM